MDELLGYYVKFTSEYYPADCCIGRIDRIEGDSFIIDDDGYGRDSMSPWVYPDEIIDISISRDDWHELEE